MMSTSTFVRHPVTHLAATLALLGAFAAGAQPGQPAPRPAEPAPGLTPDVVARITEMVTARVLENLREQPPAANREPLPTVALAPLLDRVERVSNRRFVVSANVPQQIYLGSVAPEDVDYPLLLAILRSNELAAYTSEGRTSIVRESEMRAAPTPIIENDDPSIPPDEWVSRIIAVKNVPASGLVPVLRPLLPQSAHLAAMCSVCEPGTPVCTTCPSLIVVDRYANVKRISAMVEALDR